MEFVLDNPSVWLFAIAMPLVTACAVLVPRCRLLGQKVAPWSALPALLLALSPQTTRSVDVPWLLLGSRLGLDEISRVFLFFSAVLWLTSGLFALGYLGKDSRRHLFFFFFLTAMSGNFGLILAQDMALFYVCFALMSFASYGLVVFSGDADARRAGRVYIALVIVGELLLFSGLVVAASGTGSMRWDGLGDRLVETPDGSIAMFLLCFGLAVKAGALPLHVWLPLAHPAAPVPASAVLSGAMIKAGLIGWLRLVPSETSTMFLGWSELCLVLGLAAAFYGVAIGLTQNNAKTVLAYSSISQMGLMTVGFGLAISGADSPHAALTATLVYAMHHGFAKGALFLGVGVALTACGTLWRRCLCGLGLLLPALALAGMPLTSGALAKVMLKSSASTAPENWPSTLALLLPLAAVGTTLLMARFLWIAWPNRDSRTQAQGLSVWLSWIVLLIAVALGVFLWPWGDSVSLGKSLVSPAKMLAAMWPVLVGVAIALIASAAAAAGYRFPIPVIPAGDVLQVAARCTALAVRGCKTFASSPGFLAPGRSVLSSKVAAGKAFPAMLAEDLEIGMRRSSVFGVVLLTLGGIILGLLAFS